MLSLAVGLPHSHAPLPMVVLPVIGAVLAGCCVSVLINGIPAARVGDMGLNPTCLGAPMPGFEIFTGSSKVFIGGARAARMLDLTKHCWPPPPKLKPGAAMAKIVSGANKAMAGMMVAGIATQVVGVVADGMDAASAEDPAVASANALAAGMGAAQLAMDAAAMAFGAMIGKNPCIGSPTGAILLGAPNVLIGGFPMPSGMAMLQRKLAGADLPPKKRGKNDENHQGYAPGIPRSGARRDRPGRALHGDRPVSAVGRPAPADHVHIDRPLALDVEAPAVRTFEAVLHQRERRGRDVDRARRRRGLEA